MKQVLFITYYFPPSGGSGVQRPLKFIRYLPEFGWKVTVLTVDPAFASFPDLDPNLESEIGEDVTVVRTRSWDPYAGYARFTGKEKGKAVGVGFLGSDHTSFREKAARWVRANVFLPDARVGWVKYGRKAGLELLKSQHFDAIVSTGPPHSSHLIAATVARSGAIPWIADIRDAWPDIAYADMLPTGRIARKWDLRLRDKTLRQASACVAVTEGLAKTMEKAVGRPFTLIRNGFDPADFEAVQPVSSAFFSIVHTGNMAPARNPEPLWTLMTEAKRNGTWDQLRILCVGNVDHTIISNAEKAGISSRLDVIPYVPHAEALSYTIGASLLLLPINQVSDAAGIVTGKIYEYIASGRPILGLGDPNGEAAHLLTSTGAGQMFAYDDLNGIRAFIDSHYGAWASGLPLAGATPTQAAAFSRRSQTKDLATLLNTLTGN